MKNLLVLLFLVSNYSFSADQGIDPAYLKLKVKKFAVSVDPYCSNPIIVFESATGTEFEDVLERPILGSGTLTNGSYPCVILEFADKIKYEPLENSDSSNCVIGVEVEHEICRAEHSDTILLLDGSTSNCIDGDQDVALYLSTASASSINNSSGSPFLPPSADNLNRGTQLGAPLIVKPGVTARFIVDAMGTIEDDGTRCELSEPSFTFDAN